MVSSKNILKQKNHHFPISELSVKINNKMPLNILKPIKNLKI